MRKVEFKRTSAAPKYSYKLTSLEWTARESYNNYYWIKYSKSFRIFLSSILNKRFRTTDLNTDNLNSLYLSYINRHFRCARIDFMLPRVAILYRTLNNLRWHFPSRACVVLYNRISHAQLTINFIRNLWEYSIFFRLYALTAPLKIQQFDLASPPLQHPKYYLQQQQHHHPLSAQQQSLMVGSCQGNFQNPLTNLNTATLDRFPPPPSPSLFVSTSSTNPVCSSNETVSIHEIYCYCFRIIEYFASNFIWFASNRYFIFSPIVNWAKSEVFFKSFIYYCCYFFLVPSASAPNVP